ncbi:hypothetical protein AFM12_09465 [Jiulongibacter sediminis]|uniref:Outer membrane protein beta-barrel domain-containing protein n=1 Tax=Jiulongibacter sediminis TaxID=1605367 RepID=A0A0P7BV76_9BACT|nr:hypothetical protein AFM12_09465 [Jiulongibacter sediminis]TBX25326.1 hypothetical protein TK44_09470 [Jiulongibacter sediminis]
MKDQSEKPLLSASVVLLTERDSTLTSFATTDSEGQFMLNPPGNGSFILQASFLGYENEYTLVKYTGRGIDLGTIILKERSIALEDLVVKGELSPMIVDGDTVNYNTKAFKTKEGDVVEDLLKKLPGLEVQRDGSVKAFGEDVDRVLVDGKEFFGTDTRIATKNLDADAVDEVQVFDKKSDMAEFTGIADGLDERTINLKLKEGKKAGYFGTAELASGSGERFKGRANINRFSPNNRLSFIGLANNINEQGFSMDEYFQFMGGLGAVMSGGLNLNLNDGNLPVGMDQNQGIQKTWAGGMNTSNSIGKKTTIDASAFYNSFETNLISNSSRENFLKNGSYLTSSEAEQLSGTGGVNFNVRLKTKFNPFHQLIFRLNGAVGNNRLTNTFSNSSRYSEERLINESRGENEIKASRYSINPYLTYMRKFSKSGRSLVFDSNLRLNDNTSEAGIDSKNTLFEMPPIVQVLLQNQQMTNRGNSYSVRTAFVEPIASKKFIEFSAAITDENNDSQNDYYDIINNQLISNSDLSNWFRRDYISKTGGLKYSQNNKKTRLTLAMNYESALQKGKINAENSDFRNTFQALLPSGVLEHRSENNGNLILRYFTDMREPSLLQLQPAVNNANPLNIYVGNPNLRPEYEHSFYSSFMRYDAFNFRMFYINLRARHTFQKINNAISINDQLVRTMSPVNTPSESSLNARTEFSSPLKPLKIKYKITLRGNYSQGKSPVNNLVNQTNVFGKGLNLSIENRKKEIVDLLAGFQFYRSDSRFSANTELNQFYKEQTIYAEGGLSLGERFTLKTNFDYQFLSQSFSESTYKVPLWQASASFFLDKTRKFRLTATAFDLLNKNQDINRTSSLNFNEVNQTNVLGRYFMLGLSYSIKGFKEQPVNVIRI